MSLDEWVIIDGFQGITINNWETLIKCLLYINEIANYNEINKFYIFSPKNNSIIYIGDIHFHQIFLANF